LVQRRPLLWPSAWPPTAPGQPRDRQHAGAACHPGPAPEPSRQRLTPDDRGRHKGPARAVPSNTTATVVRLHVAAASSPTRLTANPAGRSPRRTFPNHHCRSSPSSKNLPPNRLSAPINRGRQLLGSPRTTTTEHSSLLHTGAPPPLSAATSSPPHPWSRICEQPEDKVSTGIDFPCRPLRFALISGRRRAWARR
jgi:hypothetical protein